MDYSEMQPVNGEERYAEWDSEFDCWAVFGCDSGFCYGQYASQDEAETAAKQ